MVRHGSVDVWIGIFFVVFYSAQRFNTPPTNRSSTTFGRYLLALGPYCLSAVAMYLALVFAGKPALVQFLSGNEVLEQLKEPLSHPLAMALLLTAALPKVPMLADVDRWILKQLHDVASIPWEVRRMAALLCRKSVTVAGDVQVSVTRRLHNDGFDERDIRFTGEPTPARDWTLLTALLMQIDEWRVDRRMAGFCLEFAEALQGIKDRHAALLPKARMSFELLREASAETEKAREAVRRYVDDFSEQVSSLRADLLAIVSRGILRADLTEGARSRRLGELGYTLDAGRELGFTLEAGRPRLNLNQLLGLLAWFLVVILSSSVVVEPLLRRGALPPMHLLFGRALTVSVIYTVSVTCAVLPKQRWPFAKREPSRPRPVGFYFVSAAIAVLISQSISFVYSCMGRGGVIAAAHRLLLTYPWVLPTIALTFVTAFLVDDQPPRSWPRWLVSAIEGLSAAVAMMAVAWITVAWLEQRVHDRPDIVAEMIRVHGQFQTPWLPKAVSTAGAVGLLVGLLVPRWWRDAPHPVAGLAEPEEKPPDGTPSATRIPVLPPAAATRSA